MHNKFTLGILVVVAFVIFSNIYQAKAAWQETLEQYFDIVETFDQLQDWHGIKTGYVYDLADMPKKLDGSPSIWSHYYGANYPVKSDWIRNQGPDYNWRSSKALCINYGPLYCNVDVASLVGYGPTRLGCYFGDGTPESGYHVMHVFYMMKFHDGFWIKKDDGSYEYPPAVKVFDMITGFKSINEYGAPICQSNQVEYGSNNILFNVGGGGSSTPYNLYFLETQSVSSYNSDSACYAYQKLEDGNQLRGADFHTQYENGKWFGVEYRVDLGVLGNADGNMEIWIYDESGNVISYDSELNHEMQKLLSFNYNKIIFGGNYQCLIDAHRNKVTETRIYYDDFIIDDNRIGPTYFSLLAGSSSDTTPPTLSNGTPTTTLPSGTTSTTLSITTNENATCRYSTTPNTTYDNMVTPNGGTFTTTGTTTHSQTITNLTDGNTYNYYIRCQDTNNNSNTTDTTITFNISPTPTTYNLSNFTSLVTNWLGIGDNNSDVNNDGIVNTRDLGIMMSHWEN